MKDNGHSTVTHNNDEHNHEAQQQQSSPGKRQKIYYGSIDAR